MVNAPLEPLSSTLSVASEIAEKISLISRK